jgi:hypothetical protein
VLCSRHVLTALQIWDAVQVVVVYFFIPETKGRTLEELDDIFSAQNPVKESTKKKKIEVDAHGDILNVKEV